MIERKIAKSPVYIALLRSVNVGGTNKLPMAEVRLLFTSLGYRDVQTYIQSGNVIFSSGKLPDARHIETAIAQRLSVQTDVVLRSADALAKIVEGNPFSDQEMPFLHVGFSVKAPVEPDIKKLERERFVPEKFAIIGSEMYLFLPNGMARTKLPAYLLRQLKVVTTIRNWKTVNKLVELSSS